MFGNHSFIIGVVKHMIELFGISWASPENIWLLICVVGITAILAYRVRAVRHAIGQIAGMWSALVIKNYSVRKQWAKAFLMSLGLIFLVGALMRPQYRKHDQVVAQEGRDVLIALDVSRSMLATDCAPNRLECAKKKIKQILTILPSERVGLILFSGAAFVQCPLTTDYAAFCMFLDHVDAETISSGTTALGGALERALKVFEDMPNKKSKLLIMFTDGEDFSSDLKRCRERVQEQKLHVFTVGVGTAEGAPIPLYNEQGNQVGHQKDGQGKIVISRLNEDTLQIIAGDAGGMYVAITQNDHDVETIVSRLTRFEREWFEDKRVSQHDEAYHYCLAVSFICFASEWIL